MAYRDTIQAEGTLLNYWTMGDAVGATSLAALVGGTAITCGTTTAKPTAGVTGQVDGTCVQFDGVNDFASVALSLSGVTKIAVECLLWWNAYALDNAIAFEHTTNPIGSGGGFDVIPNGSDGTLQALLADLASTFTYVQVNRTDLTAAAWHHVVVVYDQTTNPDTITVYIDGTAVSTTYAARNNGTTGFANSTLYLFSRAGSSLFGAGRMQHLAIYSDLSGARVAAHATEAFGSGAATTYTMTGPAGGAVSVASTNFTVTPDGTFTGTVTMSDGGAGGTFTPTSLTWAAASTSKTFTYTPASLGAKTISATNDGGVTNAAPLTYTADTGPITLAAADLFDNGYSGTPQSSAFAFARLTTDATSLVVTGNTTVYGTFPLWAHLGVRVDGVEQSPLAFTAGGSKTFAAVTLAAGTKTVEIVTGLQTDPSGTVLGSFVDSVTLAGLSSYTIATPSVGRRVLVYGDSIAVGGNATNPESQGWPVLVRNSYHRRVMLEAWGYRALNDDGANGTARQALADRIAGYVPSVVWLAIGTNDYGLNKWAASAFGTAYADLLDKLHAALPTAAIVAQTPLVRTTETANASGSTLGNYRTQITTACGTRPWATLVDGSAILTTGDLDDGIHPTVAGHVTYAAAVNAVLTPLLLSTGGAFAFSDFGFRFGF